MSWHCPDDEYIKFISTFDALISKIKFIKDKEVCLKWFDRIQQVKAITTREKLKKITFIKFLLQVMKLSFLSDTLKLPKVNLLDERDICKLKDEILHLDNNSGDTNQDVLNKLLELEIPNYKCHWSEDGNTYVAIQDLEGEGALVYMATCDPNNPGWIKKS